jgi:hypothetical protein
MEDTDLFFAVHKGEMDVWFTFKEESEFCCGVHGGGEQRESMFGESNDTVVSGIMGRPSVDGRNKMSSV